jgi:hypothetical protein
VASLREAQQILRQRAGEHGQGTLIAGANLGIVHYRTAQSGAVYEGTSERAAGFRGTLKPSADAFAPATEYFGSPQQTWRFARPHDSEGNPIELWEPAAPNAR